MCKSISEERLTESADIAIDLAVSSVKVHIPAHREHPFRTNMNTYSGST